MRLPVVLRPEARAEFDDAFDWYEPRRPGLGVDFVAHVQEVLDQIGATPALYGHVFRDVRHDVVIGHWGSYTTRTDKAITGKTWSKQNGQLYGCDITPGRAVRNAS